MKSNFHMLIRDTPRSTFRTLCALCLFACTVPAPQATASAPQILPAARKAYSAILMWHDIVPGKKDVWFDVTVQEFRSQLEEIRRRKLNPIPLEALYRNLTQGAPLPPRPIVLTFDDTTEGLYRYAYPLLKQYHYPATYFIHTDYVGVTTVKEHCTWPQLKEMQASGLISIQSHTRTHPPDLRKVADAQLANELTGSRSIIQKQMGKPVFAFAYTEGGYDGRVLKAVEAAGYTMAMGEDWGNAGASPSMLRLHRYSVHRRWEQALDDVVRGHAMSAVRRR